MNTRGIVATTIALMIACHESPRQGTAQAQSGAQQQQSGQQQSNIDKLVAPIALYPDQLLAQILMSASDPDSVVKLNEWLKKNLDLKGTQLQDAAVKAGFEASFVALAIFPQVVGQMSSDVNWTKALGQAFAADKSAVFDSIQRLRHQAQKVGTLKDTPQQEVSSKTTSGGQDVIVIEPANPQVVYVPQYNYTTVYTQPPATVVVQDSSADEAVAAGLIGFTAGIAIGAAMDNNYYYGPYGWRGGAYMYNDAWNDYYDHREDAREDWMDHREDVMEDRGDRVENRSENRGERSGTAQQQRTDRQQNRQENRPAATSGAQGTARQGSYEAQGKSKPQTATRSGGSDAFSGYSSGKSQRAASSRGNASRGSARGGGGRRR